MDITALKTFVAAAETGSFAGAAKRVNASPSSVTERIKQLEHRLGARLFDRDKRGCRLTRAGRKFLSPASQAVRALDIARHEVSLPERFTRSLSFGGQYVLWDARLMGWLAYLRDVQPNLALRVTSGASARLNRDLGEGFLDLAVLYDPVLRRDIGSAPLLEDRLVLVTGGEAADWRKNYVWIEWGAGLGGVISSRLDLAPESGLVLDLGGRSADWLIAHRMAGYMPRSTIAPLVARGDLRLIDDAPSFDYPVFACWRRDVDAGLMAEVVSSLESAFQAGTA